MGLVKRIKYTISAIKLIPYKILYGNRLNTGKQINLGSKTKIVVTKCGKIEIAQTSILHPEDCWRILSEDINGFNLETHCKK